MQALESGGRSQRLNLLYGYGYRGLTSRERSRPRAGDRGNTPTARLAMILLVGALLGRAVMPTSQTDAPTSPLRADDPLARERARFKALLDAHPLPAEAANMYIAELHAKLTARGHDPALAEAATRQLLHLVSGYMREDSGARERWLGPDPFQITIAPVGRRPERDLRAWQLWALIDYLGVVVGRVEASSRPCGAVDLRGWATRIDPERPSFIEGLWAQVALDRPPLTPAELQELVEVPNTARLAIRVCAKAWNMTEEGVERHIMSRVRALAAARDARRRLPSPPQQCS
jgi:hypothetical protein